MFQNHLIRATKRLLTCNYYSFAQDKLYVPIRPLKQQRNVLYTIGEPQSNPIFYRFVTFTPLMAFMLQGITYEWNWLAWGGCLFSLILAARWNNLLTFNKAFECYQIAVNKTLTKFQFLVLNNYYTKLWENALLKAQNKTYEQDFVQKLHKGILPIPQEEMQRIRTYLPYKLKNEIRDFRNNRHGFYLQISESQIKSFQFVSRKCLIKKMKKNYITTMGISGESKLTEDYNTDKQEKDILVIESKKIGEENILLYVYLVNNLDKRFEEYLKALGQGKKIVNI